jgi:hypothetical protein
MTRSGSRSRSRSKARLIVITGLGIGIRFQVEVQVKMADEGRTTNDERRTNNEGSLTATSILLDLGLRQHHLGLASLTLT